MPEILNIKEITVTNLNINNLTKINDAIYFELIIITLKYG